MFSISRLLLFLFLSFTSVRVNFGQQFPEESDSEEKSILDDVSPGAESLMLRSIFRKVEDAEGDPDKEPGASQLDWITKRQHPGKRMAMDLEKRQHPGRRPLSEQYLSIPNSQLAYLNELSKRQHPGKRYLPYNKRQHPGKRGWDDEVKESEQTLEKRQHPGKRYMGSQTLDSNILCDPQDSSECSKGSLLLELLDKISKGHSEEKRQHPGRSLLDGEVDVEE